MVENSNVVLSGGYVDLTVATDNSSTQSNSIQQVIGLCVAYPNEVSAQQKNDGLASTAVFEGIKEQVKNNPEAVKKIKAIYLWKVTQNGKTVTEWSKLSGYVAFLPYLSLISS